MPKVVEKKREIKSKLKRTSVIRQAENRTKQSVQRESSPTKRRQTQINSVTNKRQYTDNRFWTAEEHKACMKAIQKHGRNFNLIVEAMKTKTKAQIRSRLKYLQTITDKEQHPDRATIQAFEKQRTPYCYWTSREDKVFVKAVKRYGKNYKMISNSVKTKTAAQVRRRVPYLIKLIAANPERKNTKIGKALKNIKIKGPNVWTKEHKETFTKALLKHGKDYNKILKHFPSMTMLKMY